MNRIGITVVLLAALGGPVGLAQGAREEAVVLMFDGKYCDAHLSEVEATLRKVAGVKAVDTKSMKGHAIVTVEGAKTDSDQLVQAVNKVKGEGWHCSAQVMR
ncbi:MAG: heavy-metal-associated domain-containing protein [Nitrospira sp.]|nr:heavy-metal-associated domain-containing protein [Nitrospira sp.]